MTLNNLKFGIAPIAWTNDDMPHLGKENTFEACLSDIALAGYDGTEIGNKFPKDPDTLNYHLGLRHLSIGSMWFSSFLCSESYQSNEQRFIETLNFLEKIGASRVNVCELTHCLFDSTQSMFNDNKPVANEQEWTLLCDGLNKLGAIANSRGIKLCYHHHMATIVQTLPETIKLLNNTDSDKVHLCFDTGHFAFSGEDIIEAYEKCHDRISHIHFKDLRNEQTEIAKKDGYSFRESVLNGCFTVPGDGMIDFLPVLKLIDKYDYSGWIIVEAEQDPAKANPLEYAISAKKYIENLLKNFNKEVKL
ncbi:myo-inosose-2 dehydratase [Mammaliicoccus sciuri]|uniref:myo-inosose-2 dehydratase n=1 Tax=Mammaliicoccus sciuri TaxID=1296 RepID=UPI001FB5665C|nr:myo-inosose-2 dehydratase [Mammaliicoccus sciuri]MCJ0925882.1 myo-inosose-2 dehydratase [Mammaliicoccus sciuri]MCJ1760479.1 myo-inosose-2 dehydratase [Mammaliicoccus sciuri]